MPVPAAVPLIAAGVTAAGAIGSKLLGNAQARKMADYEFSNNLKMWNLQNAYNSPAQQMQRLKDAGLNPNLVYGNGAVGNTAGGTLPQYHAPTLDYNATDVIQTAGGTLSQFVNLEKVAMEKEVLAAQAESIRQRTALDTLREVGLREGAIKSQAIIDMFKDPDVGYDKKLVYQQAENADWFRRILGERKEAWLAQLAKGSVEAQSVDIENKKAELIYRQFENDLRRNGINSSDSPVFRILLRILQSVGMDPFNFIKGTMDDLDKSIKMLPK